MVIDWKMLVEEERIARSLVESLSDANLRSGGRVVSCPELTFIKYSFKKKIFVIAIIAKIVLYQNTPIQDSGV